MQLRPKEIQNVYKAGIFLAFLMLVMLAFTFFLSKDNSLIDSKITLGIDVSNAQNLKAGAVVHLKGLRIGSVKKIIFKTIDILRVEFIVSAEYQHLIKTDSIVAFRTMGMLGDRYIEIIGGSEAAVPISKDATLQVEQSLEMKDFINKGDNLLGNANEALMKMNTLLEDLTAQHSMRSTMDNLNSISLSLKKNMAHPDMSGLMSNMKKTSDSLSLITADLASITGRIKNGPGAANSFIYDNSVYEDLQTLLGGAQRNKMLKYFIQESIKKAQKPDKEKDKE